MKRHTVTVKRMAELREQRRVDGLLHEGREPIAKGWGFPTDWKPKNLRMHAFGCPRGTWDGFRKGQWRVVGGAK